MTLWRRPHPPLAWWEVALLTVAVVAVLARVLAGCAATIHAPSSSGAVTGSWASLEPSEPAQDAEAPVESSGGSEALWALLVAGAALVGGPPAVGLVAGIRERRRA